MEFCTGSKGQLRITDTELLGQSGFLLAMEECSVNGFALTMSFIHLYEPNMCPNTARCERMASLP